jgi:hypothetical protein
MSILQKRKLRLKTLSNFSKDSLKDSHSNYPSWCYTAWAEYHERKPRYGRKTVRIGQTEEARRCRCSVKLSLLKRPKIAC